jgi:hypothetical protein
MALVLSGSGDRIVRACTSLIVGNGVFGVSSSLRHTCSAVLPDKLDYVRYDWKRTGLWRLLFVAGIMVGASSLRDGNPVRRRHAVNLDL